jgi:FkbM family methyltransferase
MLAARIAEFAKSIPPFNRIETRIAFVRRRAQVGSMRRRIFERLGSARYSRPALYEMDRKLEPYLPFDGGFFVEAGANDGYLQSNTYYLEKFKNWKGILIEPIPELYELCLLERPQARVFNCALVPEGHPESTVRMTYAGLMSLVTGAQGSNEADRAHAEAGTMLGWDRNYEVEVPARTLSAILDQAAAPDIDLLSLDVEGYEPEALAGLNLDRWAPRYLLIEAVDEERRRRLDDLLGERYERVEQLSPFDVLYRRLTPPQELSGKETRRG